MELYPLDGLLRPDSVIERFISVIWTERFSDKGEFELVLPSTLANRNLLKTGMLLASDVSHRVMRLDSVEDKTDDEGRRILEAKGPSIETLFDERVAKATMSDLETEPKWVITDTPGNTARKIVRDICITGTLSLNDKIPFIVEGTFMPEDTIPEPTDTYLTEIEPKSVYAAVKEVCDLHGLGFRLLRHPVTYQLYFDVYSGSDRTTGQTLLQPVVFTPEIGNLQNSTQLTTISQAKNVAYVFSTVGFQVVYGTDVNPDVEGFERRVLVVNATDVTEETEDIPGALIQRGKEELSKYQAFAAFDGEVTQNAEYVYGNDYNLGDITEIRSADGVTSHMRVTEQIFVQDKQGYRTYPTLALNAFVNAGSWLTFTGQVWEDMGATEYWADQP